MLKQVQHDKSKKSLDSRFRGNDIKNSSHATKPIHAGNAGLE
ncbi:hypothetical protein [Rickettsia endosymbiont of Orchestes rusci]